MTTPRPIGALGEIALRVENLPAMEAFYENVVGLELMRRFPGMTFFRIADGYAGHTQILALFDRTTSPDYQGIRPAHTTVDHLAFAIAREDFPRELARLDGLGIPVETTTHAWVQWRSLYITDPEGNRVELVCFDPGVPVE
jgi:catechol 2,3-dioxygenase